MTEQIPVHRDGAGLSKLTAECTLLFGNCLRVSCCLHFGIFTLPKVGKVLLPLPSACLLKPVCWHPGGPFGGCWHFTRTDFAHLSRRASTNGLLISLYAAPECPFGANPFPPPVTHEFRSPSYSFFFFASLADGTISLEVCTAAVRQRSPL